MARNQRCSSFALWLSIIGCTLAAACKGTGSKAGAPSEPTAPPMRSQAAPAQPSRLIELERAPERDLRLELEEVTDSAAATAKDRGAVLIGADIYQALPSYGLELTAGLDALTRALTDACAVPSTAIARISGPRTIPQEIAGAINTFAESVSGQHALLVVAYAGHGVVDGDGQLQLFTHYTDRAGSGFSQTLPRSELLRWLESARARAKARGTELETILIVDACRTPTQDAPKAAKLVRNATWEMFGAADGELAQAPRAGQPSPFLEALCGGITALASQGDADLRKTFAEARRRMQDAGAKQQPQLLEARDDGGPALILPGRIRIGIEVVDRLANTRLDVAAGDLRADDQPLPRSGEHWLIETSPGRTVDLRAKVAGYLPFAQRTTFGKLQNGKVYRVPLLPGLTRVVGRITPAVAVSVTATFGDDKAVVREGFHRTRAFTRTGESAFELRLPTLRDGSTIDVTIEQAGRALTTKRITTADLVDDSDLAGARRCDLGTLELADADRSSLPSSIDPEQVRRSLADLQNDDLGVTLPPLFATPDSTAPASLNAFQRIEWDNATRALTRGDLPAARSHMQTIADGNRSQVDPAVQSWLGHLQLRQALSAQSDAEVRAAIEAAEAAQPGSDLTMALRAVLARRMLRQADQLANKADPAAVPILKEAARIEPDGDSLYAVNERQRIRERRWAIGSKVFDGIKDDKRHIEALTSLFGDDPEPWNDPQWYANLLRHSALPLEQRLRQALQVGIATGEWRDADETLALRRRAIPTDVPSRLAEVEAEIERQRVPLVVRQRVEAAKAAEVADQLDDALQLYLQARDGANTFWREQIAAAEQPLRLRIYEKHSQLGTTALQTGKPAEALAAFLRASAASGRLHSSIRPLLAKHPELAAEPGTNERIVALDAQQLRHARETRARQAWQDYLADHPQGSGADEARDMLRRLADPWQALPAAPPELTRYGAAMVYDEAREVVVLFGGATLGADGKAAPQNDTWLWDGKTWRRMQPANPPSPRAFHAMVYDPARRVTLLFGGSSDDGATGLDDTYVWDGERWSPANVNPRPAARCKHSLAFDADRKVVVLYGGSEQRDTWEWDGGSWGLMQAKSYPKYRTGPGLAYSPNDHRVLLFGGSGRDGTAWTWDGKAWTSAKKTGVEAGEAGTLTAAGERLLFFGGLGRTPSNTLLMYDPRAPQAWQKAGAGQPPSARMHHAAAFDSKRRVLVIHGGMTPPAKRRQPPTVFGDTFEFYVD